MIVCVFHNTASQNHVPLAYKLYRLTILACNLLGQIFNFPFLNTGVTFAFFQSSGISPQSYDFLNMVVSIGTTRSAISFRTQGLIWSGPDALWTLRRCSSFRTPDSVISISAISR